jgi:hypothetical protein
VPEAPEAAAATTALSIGGAEDVSTSGCWSIPGIGIIDLDSTKLPSNDWEIFDAVVDCVFADPSVLEAEVPGAATSAVAASVDVGASTSAALVPDAVVLEQPALCQDGDVEGSAPSATSEAVKGVLGESVAGMESAVIAPHSRL